MEPFAFGTILCLLMFSSPIRFKFYKLWFVLLLEPNLAFITISCLLMFCHL
ncbi:hypothetical protein M6B38_379490 [Iris pallida]|uniref:Uncharacterized protein n=1 Tax=Iris pallida TaxID=29817 RepID=A0AAX6G935_IRIPA|nr:hypothetical protein M6B38_379490 [Iris pallida]